MTNPDLLWTSSHVGKRRKRLNFLLIVLDITAHLVRCLGCNDLSACKKFTLQLGLHTNMLTYSVPNSGLPVPVKIKTDVGFAILIDELHID